MLARGEAEFELDPRHRRTDGQPPAVRRDARRFGTERRLSARSAVNSKMAAESPVSPASSTVNANLRSTLFEWGPIVAGLAFLYAPSSSISSAGSGALMSRHTAL